MCQQAAVCEARNFGGIPVSAHQDLRFRPTAAPFPPCSRLPYPTGPAYRERVNADEHEEIAASVAAHTELGPTYDAAVAEGLVERIGEEIDRRVDARLRSLGLEQQVSPQVPQQHVSQHSGPQQALPQHYGHAAGAAGHPGSYLSPGLRIVPPGYRGDPRYGAPAGPASAGPGPAEQITAPAPAVPFPPGPPAPSTGAMVAATVLALGSMGLGVGATAVVGSHAVTAAAQTVMVMLIWGAIAVINIVYARLR